MKDKITTRKVEPHVWRVYAGDELLGTIEKLEGRARWRAIPPAGRDPIPLMPRSRVKAIWHLRMARAQDASRPEVQAQARAEEAELGRKLRKAARDGRL